MSVEVEILLMMVALPICWSQARNMTDQSVHFSNFQTNSTSFILQFGNKKLQMIGKIFPFQYCFINFDEFVMLSIIFYNLMPAIRLMECRDRN